LEEVNQYYTKNNSEGINGGTSQGSLKKGSQGSKPVKKSSAGSKNSKPESQKSKKKEKKSAEKIE